MALLQLRELAKSIAETEPTDQRAQAAILERLGALREAMQASGQHDFAAFLEVAAILTESLARGTHLTPERVGALVSRLVKRVVARFDGEVDPGLADEPAPSVPSATAFLRREMSNEGMRMMQDQCLGEILVQLGSVTREQIEQGLRAQRATGVRIGEALVMLGLLNWDQIEAGVRLQERLRDTVVRTTAGLRLDD